MMRECEAADRRVCVNYRTAAADTAHHHHRTDVRPCPTEQASVAGSVPHDGKQRAKTLYDARSEERG